MGQTRRSTAKGLTPKQARFVAEYLVDLNGTQAAIRAGYSKRTAQEQSSDLLSKPIIAQAVARGKARQLEAAELSATRVLEEYRRLAFVDVRSFFDERGNLKPIGQLTEEQGSALASLEVIIKNAKAGDGIVDEVHKIKLWDKTRALESLAKHFGLLIERLEVSASAELVERLAKARARR